jgi:hypothetical protein
MHNVLRTASTSACNMCTVLDMVTTPPPSLLRGGLCSGYHGMQHMQVRVQVQVWARVWAWVQATTWASWL